MSPELIGLARVLAPVGIGAVVVLVVRHVGWLRQLVLFLVIGYLVFVAERMIAPGTFAGWQNQGLKWLALTADEIPYADREAGDNYLKQRLGEDNFKRFVEYDPESSEELQVNSVYRRFKLVYHFLPLKEYQSEDEVVLEVQNNQVEAKWQLPECAEDPSLCEFNVSRAELLEIARARGLTSESRVVGTTTLVEHKLALEVKDCEKKLRVVVDYRDGRVIRSGEASCQ